MLFRWEIRFRGWMKGIDEDDQRSAPPTHTLDEAVLNSVADPNVASSIINTLADLADLARAAPAGVLKILNLDRDSAEQPFAVPRTNLAVNVAVVYNRPTATPVLLDLVGFSLPVYKARYFPTP